MLYGWGFWEDTQAERKAVALSYYSEHTALGHGSSIYLSWVIAIDRLHLYEEQSHDSYVYRRGELNAFSFTTLEE